MKKNNTKKKEIFYAVVCNVVGICGAFCSKKEAREFNGDSELSLCPCKHKIVKCVIKLIKK